MFYAYVIQSLVKENYLYKGHCEHLQKRLEEHNAGKTCSIKAFIPFKLIYSEAYQTREEAIAKEGYWKTAAGRRYLQKKLKL